MPGSQFVHLNGYALKASNKGHSVANIIAEATRREGSCPHIAEAIPPRLRYGVDPEVILPAATARLSKARDSRGRRLPLHTLVVFAAVASYPTPWADPDLAEQDVEFWIDANLAFFQKLWGNAFLCALEHLDEAHPHIHCFAVAPLRSDHTLDVDAVSAMHAAQAAVRLAGGGRKEQRLAFCDRARAFQNTYFDAVAGPCGLTRMGPARQRLSRAEWKAQKETAAAEARRRQAAEQDRAELARRRGELTRQREELDRRRAKLASAEDLIEATVQSSVARVLSSFRMALQAAEQGLIWLHTDPDSGRDRIRISPDIAHDERALLIEALQRARPMGLFAALRSITNGGAPTGLIPVLRM